MSKIQAPDTSDLKVDTGRMNKDEMGLNLNPKDAAVHPSIEPVEDPAEEAAKETVAVMEEGEPSEEETTVEAEAETETEDETEGDEETLVEEETSAYQARLLEMARELQRNNQVAPEPETPAEDNVVTQFFTDEDVLDLTAEKLNKVLTDFGRNVQVETIKAVIPGIQENVRSQVAMQTMFSEFYRENSDLIPVNEYVGFMSKKLQREHPDWSLVQLMNETEKVVRKDLNKVKSAKRVKAAKKPKFPRKPASRKSAPGSKPVKSKLQTELDEMTRDRL